MLVLILSGIILERIFESCRIFEFMNNLLNFEGLVSDIDLLVGALFVDLVNMDLSLFHEHTTDI